MSSLKSKIATGGATALVVILMIAALYGVSWIVTCGIIKLITMCFGLTFKWSIATGIWLIICNFKVYLQCDCKEQVIHQNTYNI